MDIVFIIVFLFSLILTILVARYVFVQVKGEINSLDIATNESRAVFDNFEVAWPIFDKAMIMIFVGLVISLVISSFMIPSHPIFLIINIVGLFFLIFLSAVISNLYYELTASDGATNAFNSIVDDGNNFFKIQTFFMKYLPWISVVLIFLLTIIMFSKGKADAQY